MSDKKSNDSRRKLLKSIAAGSGAVVAGKSLPESWSKPVINSIVLPAHAELTDGSGSSGDGVTTTPAATTTPECCLIDGTYCGNISRAGLQIELVVEPDGSVTISGNRSGGWAKIATVQADDGCMGGVFRYSASTFAIAGTVVCGRGSIDFDAFVGGTRYTGNTAAIDGCPD